MESTLLYENNFQYNIYLKNIFFNVEEAIRVNYGC